MEFSSFGLHPDLLRGVTDLGFTRPTPIQEQALPAGLAGKDLLAAAQTGSGKTAAFLLPILQRLIDQPRGKTRALILTPTRELAAQIHEHFEALAKYTRLRGAAVFGGVGMGPQEQAFRTGVDVIIATPGRLLDHFQNAYARLDSLEVLVLDEADRMLDMGFLPDIRRVLRHIPAKRQTLFFSATMPAPIVELSRDMLRSPEAINIERKQAPAKGVAQALYPVSEELKAHLFLELLRRGEIGNVIVFTRTKHRANRLSDFLDKHGVPNARIHGNRSQAQRTEALAGFKSGSFRVLVATDIVARGIDVEALEHVVNFDVPHLPEDYIHRVGRTARKDATGDAYTFVSPDEERDLKAIERAVGKPIPRRIVEGFDYRNKPVERFEVPIQERIAEIRARKAEERARAKAKAERKAQRDAEEAARVARGGRPAQDGGARRPQPQGQSQGQSSSSQGEGGGRRRSRGGRGRAGAGSGGPR
ncbi:MAG TPA: DEAD/DEAH box helicase [Longimicrobiaceae bacterium]|nr:DEAD/DEAH box helicase [Longimicrobiaceae bacterium]